MWWQALSALGSLAIAVPAVVIGVLAFRRTSHAEDVGERAAAAEVGLKYLERSLAAQQDTITRQEGEIGELRGQLKECRDERQQLSTRIAELEERMP